MATKERVINRSIRTTIVDLQIRRMFTDSLVHYQPTFTLPMNNLTT